MWGERGSRLPEKDERPCLGAPPDTTARYPDALRLNAAVSPPVPSAEACACAQPFFSSPPPLYLKPSHSREATTGAEAVLTRRRRTCPHPNRPLLMGRVRHRPTA